MSEVQREALVLGLAGSITAPSRSGALVAHVLELLVADGVAAEAMRFSPKSRRRRGSPSLSGSSLGMKAGNQYSRMNSPMGVPGPTLHTSSLP